MTHLDAFGQRAGLRPHAGQPAGTGSTRRRPMPTARKFDPAGYLALRLAPDMLPLHAAGPDRQRRAPRTASRAWPASRRRSSRTTRRRSTSCARASAKTIDYLQSVPAAQIDGTEDTRDRRCRARGEPMRFEGRDLPEALRAAELLLPRDDDLRAAAPQRRRTRQARLPRAGLTHRGSERLRRRRAAPRPRRSAAASRRGKCRSSAAMPAGGLGLVVAAGDAG